MPADFTEDETVTLLLGIVNDNDVVYINGQPVAASGFADGNGEAADLEKFPAAGGFVCAVPEAERKDEDTASASNVKSVPAPDAEADPDTEPASDTKPVSDAEPLPAAELVPALKSRPAPEEQVKWVKFYWEIEREYAVPASILKEGADEIAIRIYNNSFGGFYSGHNYALCGNEQAVGALKGLPTDTVDAPEILAAVEAQITAPAAGSLEAYAATIADNYHNDAVDKVGRVAATKALLNANGAVVAEDAEAVVYQDAAGDLWYSAFRALKDGEGNVFSSGPVEICFAVSGGAALERGNWNRCCGTGYHSALFDKTLTDLQHLSAAQLLHGYRAGVSHRVAAPWPGFQLYLLLQCGWQRRFYGRSDCQGQFDGDGPGDAGLRQNGRLL